MRPRCNSHPATEYRLQQRWPSVELSRSFRGLLSSYSGLCARRLARGDDAAAAMRESYALLCRWICEPPVRHSDSSGDGERAALQSIIRWKRDADGPDWLQAVASLLGMLMHFSPDGSAAAFPVNRRRPQKPFSTYPNSPPLARFLGDAAAARLLRSPVPTVCHRSTAAERYAERALNFRVLDPSAESGQLLLEVALGCVRPILRRHSADERTARRLARAVLEKLCRDCLWGVDRNPLSAVATATVFSLLGEEFGVKGLAPAHLATADVLESLGRDGEARFDAVVNNPPWGEALSPEERRRLRQTFLTPTRRIDTYVAFSELAVRVLRPGGFFGLVLPSQVIGALNAARLRELLARETHFEGLVLLPRAAFADATVRAAVVLGRKLPARPPADCRVVTYPLEKRLGVELRPRSRLVPGARLRALGDRALPHLLRPLAARRTDGGRCVPLEDVASVMCGVRMYGRGRGTPPQTDELVRKKRFTFTEPAPGTVPAIRGRDFRPFRIDKPGQFILLGEWLVDTGRHASLRGQTRVFLRELCRRDGMMTAAAAVDGFVPLHGVLTVVPRMIDAHVLVAILNSSAAAEYVRHNTAAFTKVDFQKITVGELRRLPIPRAAVKAVHRRALGLPPSTARETALRRLISSSARALARAPAHGGARAETLRARLDAAVSKMYALQEGEADVH